MSLPGKSRKDEELLISYAKGDSSSFAKEACGVLGPVPEVLVQDLDRHVAAEGWILGAKDDGHPPPADLLDEPVA